MTNGKIKELARTIAEELCREGSGAVENMLFNRHITLERDIYRAAFMAALFIERESLGITSTGELMSQAYRLAEYAYDFGVTYFHHQPKNADDIWEAPLIDFSQVESAKPKRKRKSARTTTQTH